MIQDLSTSFRPVVTESQKNVQKEKHRLLYRKKLP